jgi:hypothetical protein
MGRSRDHYPNLRPSGQCRNVAALPSVEDDSQHAAEKAENSQDVPTLSRDYWPVNWYTANHILRFYTRDHGEQFNPRLLEDKRYIYKLEQFRINHSD